MSDSEQSERPEDQKNQKQEKGFFEEILGDVANIDFKLPATFWGMIKSPQTVITAYFEDKGRYTNPFRYTVIVIAFAMVIFTFFVDYGEFYKSALEAGAGEDMETFIAQLSEQVPGFDWELYFQRMIEITILLTQKFLQLTLILIFAPIIALFSYLFFKKKKSRFIQHYVMMIYLLATYSAFSVLFAPYYDSSDLTDTGNWAFLVGIPLMLAYMYWVLYKYMKVRGFKEHIKIILTGTLGYIVYSIMLAFIMYGGALIWVLIE